MRTAPALALLLLLGGAWGAHGQPMGKREWQEQMEAVVPASLCQGGSYFRTCFAQSAGACVNAARAALRACLRRHDGQIPGTFRSGEDAGRWSRYLAACAGTEFESRNRKLKVSTGRCGDPGAWR